MLCFVVVMQSFIMNSHEVFIHIHQGCFAGTGAIVRLPQCQWSKPDGYGKISQCITTTKQKPCAYFFGYTVLATAKYHHAKWSGILISWETVVFILLFMCYCIPLTPLESYARTSYLEIMGCDISQFCVMSPDKPKHIWRCGKLKKKI